MEEEKKVDLCALEPGLVLVTYKYMWRIRGEDRVRFRYLTDLPVGHEAFIQHIKSIDGISAFLREYICEYCVARVGTQDVFVTLDEEEK